MNLHIIIFIRNKFKTNMNVNLDIYYLNSLHKLILFVDIEFEYLTYSNIQ